MSRRRKILLSVLAGFAVLLGINTVIVNGQTDGAEINVDGAQILNLPTGDVQVADTPAADSESEGAPIVLLHCWTCSMRWWDAVLPQLSENHRVIRIDLLGHGGSEKPKSGYELDNQAALVAGVLGELEVEGATVVGHSMGGAVLGVLVEESSQLVDRAVVIDMAPNDEDYGGSFPLTAKALHVPVIGQALWRTKTDFLVKRGQKSSYAKGFDVDDAWEDPDTPIEDLDGMTYASHTKSTEEAQDSVNDRPLTDRFTTAGVPLLVILGAEDQTLDAKKVATAYESVPGASVSVLPGIGHSPPIEDPDQTASLILEFLADAGDEALSPLPKDKRGKRDRKSKKNRK